MMHVKLLQEAAPSTAFHPIGGDPISAMERQAQRVASRYFDRPQGDEDRDDVLAGVELEIMLVLAYLDRIRRAHKKSLDRLLELEAKTNTTRMRLRPWGDLSGGENTPAFFRLDDRLFKLELDRLHLNATIDERLRPSHDRLHQLMIRHVVLDL